MCGNSVAFLTQWRCRRSRDCFRNNHPRRDTRRKCFAIERPGWDALVSLDVASRPVIQEDEPEDVIHSGVGTQNFSKRDVICKNDAQFHFIVQATTWLVFRGATRVFVYHLRSVEVLPAGNDGGDAAVVCDRAVEEVVEELHARHSHALFTYD